MAMLGAAAIGAVGAVGAAAISSGGGGSSTAPGYRKQQNIAMMQKQLGTQKANMENELFKEQLMQSERFRMGAFNLLGTPGTFEQSYEDYYAGLQGGGPGVGAPTGLFSLVEKTEQSDLNPEALMRGGIGIYSKKELKDARKWEKSGGLKGAPLDPSRTETRAEAWVLNPDAALQQLAQSRQFRMVSQMTAEADQLVRQEGPMWEKLQQSVMNPIMQGAAAANEQMMENLAREAARGGTARNRAVQTARKVQAQNDIMRDRVNAMWTSNLALKQWTVDNARAQLAFNQSWTANLGGIRDNYSNFMQNTQQFYGSQILPSVINAQNQNQRSADEANSVNAQMQQMQAERDANLAGIVAGATQVAAGGLLRWDAQRKQQNQPYSYYGGGRGGGMDYGP